jgi:hypothetical protein
MEINAHKLIFGNVYFTPWSKKVRDVFRISIENLSFYTNQTIIDFIKFSFINRGFEIVLSNPTLRPHMIFNNKTGRPKIYHESN